MSNFEQVKTVTDESISPFPDAIMYLYITMDYGDIKTAYKLRDHTIVDIKDLAREAVGYEISTEVCMHGSNTATLIMEGRAPNTSHVWDSCDFYINHEEY